MRKILGPDARPRQDISKIDEIAIVDVRVRHESLVQVIYNRDRKAVQFIQIYLAFIGVFASFTVVKLGSSEFLYKFLAVISFGVIFFLIIGVLQAFRAQGTADIYCTGMKADFWEWRIDERVPPNELVKEYLKSASERLAHNEGVNADTADALHHSFNCGKVASCVGLLGFGVLVLHLLSKM